MLDLNSCSQSMVSGPQVSESILVHVKNTGPGMHRLTELEFLGMGPRNVHLINFCKVFLPTQKSENHSQ